MKTQEWSYHVRIVRRDDQEPIADQHIAYVAGVVEGQLLGFPILASGEITVEVSAKSGTVSHAAEPRGNPTVTPFQREERT